MGMASLCPMGLGTRPASVMADTASRGKSEPRWGTPTEAGLRVELALAGVFRDEGVGPLRGSLPLSSTGIRGRSPLFMAAAELCSAHPSPRGALLPGALCQEVIGRARKQVRLHLAPTGGSQLCFSVCLQDVGGMCVCV